MNGSLSAMISGFDEFDRLVNAALFDAGYTPSNKLKDCVCSSQFPHSDIWEDEDKGLNVKVALPGWTEDQLRVDFQEDYVILKGKRDVETRKYIQKGIKDVTEFKISFFVDPRRYDARADVAQFTLKDGNLLMRFPKNAQIINDTRYGFGKLIEKKDEPVDEKENKDNSKE